MSAWSKISLAAAVPKKLGTDCFLVLQNSPVKQSSDT